MEYLIVGEDSNPDSFLVGASFARDIGRTFREKLAPTECLMRQMPNAHLALIW